jgi:hypothetical protein
MSFLVCSEVETVGKAATVGAAADVVAGVDGIGSFLQNCGG